MDLPPHLAHANDEALHKNAVLCGAQVGQHIGQHHVAHGVILDGSSAKNRRGSVVLQVIGGLGQARVAALHLSGGMRRRVAILRALLCGADVIALDEPFKGLDEATRARVIAETKRLCRGKTVLLVTHEAAEAERMGAKIVGLLDSKG